MNHTARAIMAFRLASIQEVADPVLTAHRHPLHNYWIGTLEILHRFGENLSLQLRYLKTQQNGPIGVHLLLLAGKSSEKAAADFLSRVSHDLHNRLLYGINCCDFLPVRNRKLLDEICSPFPFADIGEYAPVEKNGLLAEGEPIYQWWDRQPAIVNSLDFYGALAAFPGRVMYVATLRPTTLTSYETNRLIYNEFDPEQLSKPKSMQTQYIPPHFTMHAGLVADRGITSDLIYEIGRRISEGYRLSFHRPTQKTNREKAEANVRDHAFHFWMPTIASTAEKRLRFLVTAENALRAFRLPVPTKNSTELAVAQRIFPLPDNSRIARNGAVLGYVSYGGLRVTIKQPHEHAKYHTYLVGKTGPGKSTLMLNMVLQRINEGHGIALIDPHGDLANDLVQRIPEKRLKDVIFYDPTDVDWPIGLNLIEHEPKHPEQKTLLIDELLVAFNILYDLRQTGGPLFETYFRNAMLAIMDAPHLGANITMILKFFSDHKYRKLVLQSCQDPLVINFWEHEAENARGEISLNNISPYITSTLNSFIYNHFIQGTCAQDKSSFDFRDVLDKQQILIVRLNKGRLGEKNAYLLGMTIVSRLFMAAMYRTDISLNERTPFHCFIDEWQNLMTPTMTQLFAEARKFALNLVCANQHLDQLSEKILCAVLGNVGTLIAFRLGPKDAHILAQAMGHPEMVDHLISLPNYQALVDLAAEGRKSTPMLVSTFPMAGNPSPDNLQKAIQLSRQQYSVPRKQVLESIADHYRKSEPKQ